MPAILTLHSGAALARSSNLISEAPAGLTDADATHTVCVDKSSVTDLGSGVYDLGPSRDAHVTMIDNRNSYYMSQGKSKPISPSAMCEMGSVANIEDPYGNFYWKDAATNDWRKSQVKQGFVASMGAYSSFAFDVSKSFIE